MGTAARKPAKRLTDQARSTRDRPSHTTDWTLPVSWIADNNRKTFAFALGFVGADPVGLVGARHMLEHLVFAGTSTHPTSADLYGTVEELGCQVEGYTSHDGVTFVISGLAEAAPQAVALLLEIVTEPRLAADIFDDERETILQEIGRDSDDPREAAQSLLYRAAFGDTSLSRPILGTEDDVRALSIQAVRRFREAYWHRETARVCAVGNLRALTSLEALREQVACALDTRAAARDARPSAAAQFAPRTLVDTRDTNQAYLRVLFVLRDLEPTLQRWAEATVYATALGGSLASTLVQELRVRRRLCYSLYAHTVWHQSVGTIQVMLAADPERIGDALSGVLDAVSTRRGPLSAVALRRARAVALGELTLELDKAQDCAEVLLQLGQALGTTATPEMLLAALRSVDAEAVNHLADSLSSTAAVSCVGPVDGSRLSQSPATVGSH